MHFCIVTLHFCWMGCNAGRLVLFLQREEVGDMKKKWTLAAKLARKAAEKALQRNANSTTCFGIYQPKVPQNLKQFKSNK